MKMDFLAKANPEFVVLIVSTLLLASGAAWIYPPLGLIVPGAVGVIDVLIGRMAKAPSPAEGSDV